MKSERLLKEERRIYFNNFFNRIIVMSPLHNTERRAYIEQHFEERGITNWEFQDAINYKLLTSDARKFLSSSGLLSEEGQPWLPLKNTQIVACLSLLQMLQKCRHNFWDKVLHVEDDVFFYENYEDLFYEAVMNLPDDWDALHFYSHIPVGCGNFNDAYREKINDYIYKGFSEGSGAICIGFNRRAIELMFTRIFPIDSGIDGIVNTASGNWYYRHEEYTAYICKNFMCYENRSLPNTHKAADITERGANDAHIIPPHMTTDKQKKELESLAKTQWRREGAK